jgi:hypothetical protein
MYFWHYLGRRPSAGHMRSELSTVRSVSFVIPATGVPFDQVDSAIEDRDFSGVLDLHERLGCDAAPNTVIAQR